MNYEIYLRDSYTSSDMWRLTRWLERGGFSYYVTATAEHFTVAYVADAAEPYNGGTNDE